MSSADRVRDLIARQRVATSRRPPQLECSKRPGDVVAFVLSVTVLVYALIDTVIGVFL